MSLDSKFHHGQHRKNITRKVKFMKHLEEKKTFNGCHLVRYGIFFYSALYREIRLCPRREVSLDSNFRHKQHRENITRSVKFMKHPKEKKSFNGCHLVRYGIFFYSALYREIRLGPRTEVSLDSKFHHGHHRKNTTRRVIFIEHFKKKKSFNGCLLVR
ncbi:hypothetical protein WA026_022626 [Henosepilachna vigintioctopunctata]|uniref:Uncharacterized protein n=1 Tax=Henosepilachna vigintioctopunctata TaxID=420089 RepID=A0AAW1U6D2_9CUCU